MELLKGLVRGLASVSLKIGLISFAVALSLTMVFGSPAAIKQALSSGGAYESVADGDFGSSIRDTINSSDGQSATIPDQLLADAAKSTFTPEVLKNSTEQITDGIYAWLRGQTAEPDFKVDLSGEKQRFTESLANSVAERARQLPACTLAQISELANSTPDPWNLPCMPPGYDIAVVRDRAVAELASKDEFLKDPIITAEDFPKDSEGKSVFQTASDAPRIFGWLLMAPWVIAILTLLSAAGLFLLHDSKRRALRTVAIALLGSGIVLLIISLIYRLLFKQGIGTSPVGGTDVFQAPLLQSLAHLQNAVSTKLLWFGIIYTVLGILILLALHFNKRVEEIQTTATSGDKPQPNAFNDSVLPPPTNDDQNRRDKNSF